MATKIPSLGDPEIFFGFVAPIGGDITSSVRAFRRNLEQKGYRVEEIKVTSIFWQAARVISPKINLVNKPLQDRFTSHIAFGNQLREHFDDNALLVDRV